MNIPVSTFITTSVLNKYAKSLDIIKSISCDYHVHSHTHNTKKTDSEMEISTSAIVFEKYFGNKPTGYRAPQGVLRDNDIDIIKKYGFKFSSSIFPSYRIGKFNNIYMPTSPFIYTNGIVELPFAVIPLIRYIISLSYLKILGFSINRILYLLFGLPNIVIFDTHLSDFIVNEKSYNKLPARFKLAYGINKYSGFKIFERFINILKEKGYKFLTMSELYQLIADNYL